MEDLLRSAHEYDRANELERLIELLQTDSALAVDFLLSKEFWGGSGSYFDFRLSEHEHSATVANVRVANHRYVALLLRVLRCLKAMGHARPDFNWLEDHLQRAADDGPPGKACQPRSEQ
jgi:hypothetical protein